MEIFVNNSIYELFDQDENIDDSSDDDSDNNCISAKLESNSMIWRQSNCEEDKFAYVCSVRYMGRTCYCENGIGAITQLCYTAGDHVCSSCDEGFILDTDTFMCISNF